MIKKNPLLRQLTLAVALMTLTLAANAWAVDSGQNQKKKKKKKNKSPSVSQVLKKVDRQILSYNPEKARELLGEVEDKNDPDIEAAMGRILILETEYEQAAEKLLAASKSSNDPFVLVDLGDAYAYARNQGNAQSSYQQAIQKAQAALAESPDDSNARFTLGVAQQRLKQYDQAAENLDRARIADPRNERIVFQLGLTQMLLGDNQGGFDQLTKAVDLYSGYAYAYYYRALAADKIGRKDILINDLDRFVFLAPDAPEAEKARRILQGARG